MRGETLTRRLVVGLGAAVAVLVVDQTTKAIAPGYIGAPVRVIPGVLTFTYAENTGASFSLFQGAGFFLGLAAIAAVALTVGALLRPRPLGEVVGFGLIAGGALGNLTDRVLRGPGWFDGAVVDWIQLPNFPVFNLADTAITFGVALLMIAAWRSR